MSLTSTLGGLTGGSNSGNSDTNGGGTTIDATLGNVLSSTPATDGGGLLAGLNVLDLANVDLSLLGPTLGHVAVSLDGSPVTLPSNVDLGGILGTTGADVVHLAADTQLGSAVLGAGDDILDAPATAIVTGILDGGDGNDRLMVGAGNTELRGGAGDDTLTALGTGNNVIDGGTGADTMAGGLGDDTYVVDNSGDRVVETPLGGVDTVDAWISYTLPDNVERLVLMGHDALNGTGNALDNTITGNDAANVLDGGAGADTMTGGLGDDTYVVDNAGDQVIEAANGGTDTVLSAVTYGLGGTYVENLTLTGQDAVNATGNSLANVLTGNDAANVLDGGTGADTMAGGAGDDTYYVDNTADRIVERAGQGTDTVYTTVSYSLSGAYVENLVLTGHDALNITGNSLDNTLTGNDGNNVIDGVTGVDTMIGGAGDDTYIVNNSQDQVIENANEGIDTIRSSVSYSLAGTQVENLILTGTADSHATGSDVANVLTGNAGANVLDGGAGADTMSGGKGDDTYVVDNAGDVIKEASGGGTDTVMSSISYTLASTLENLTLTGSQDLDGTGTRYNNTLLGNAGDNHLYGLAGVDTLNGGDGNDVLVGGAGQDFMTGGAGADRFVFNTGDFGGRVEVTADDIKDFSSAQGDKIDLSGVDADLTHAGQQAFRFIGAAAFDAPGEVRAYESHGNTFLEINLNGDPNADFKIKLDGLHDIQASDLILA